MSRGRQVTGTPGGPARGDFLRPGALALGRFAYELNRNTDEPDHLRHVREVQDRGGPRGPPEAGEHNTKLLKSLEPLTGGELKAKVYAVPE